MNARSVFSSPSKLWNAWQFLPIYILAVLAPGGLGAPAAGAAEGREIERSFRNPPDEAKVWVYWWWLNGCVTKDGIVRDLDHMKSKGISHSCPRGCSAP